MPPRRRLDQVSDFAFQVLRANTEQGFFKGARVKVAVEIVTDATGTIAVGEVGKITKVWPDDTVGVRFDDLPLLGEININVAYLEAI
ncbi:hypothetical protein IT417_00565 [bacterium]|nr:hypothetical protein [bacterium]